MTKEEALEILADGHAIVTNQCALEICQTLNVPFDSSLSQKWYSDPAGTFKGLTMETEGATGVSVLALGCSIIKHLNLSVPTLYGTGSQARAYSNAIQKVLNL